MKIKTIISTAALLFTAMQTQASFTLDDVLNAAPQVASFESQEMNLKFGEPVRFKVQNDEFELRFFKYNWPDNDLSFEDAINLIQAGSTPFVETKQAPNAIFIDDSEGSVEANVKQWASEMGIRYTLSLACLSEESSKPTATQVIEACKEVASWKPSALTYPGSEDSLIALADGIYQIRYFRFYLGEDQNPTFADFVKARDLAAMKPSERQEKGDKILTFISEDKKSFVLSLGKVD